MISLNCNVRLWFDDCSINDVVMIMNKGWHVPMSVRRYEVEATVDSSVFDVVSVKSGLVLIELFKLLLHVVSNRLPASHNVKHSPIHQTAHSRIRQSYADHLWRLLLWICDAYHFMKCSKMWTQTALILKVYLTAVISQCTIYALHGYVQVWWVQIFNFIIIEKNFTHWLYVFNPWQVRTPVFHYNLKLYHSTLPTNWDSDSLLHWTL